MPEHPVDSLIAAANNGASTTAPIGTIRVTSRIQPAARSASSRCVQGTLPRRAQSTTSAATISAATSAGTERNEVGPHSGISDVRSDTANWASSSRGPTGVRAVTSSDATGTANISTARRPVARRSRTRPTQATKPTSTPADHSPWAVAHAQVSAISHQRMRPSSQVRSQACTVTARRIRLTTWGRAESAAAEAKTTSAVMTAAAAAVPRLRHTTYTTSTNAR